MNVFFVSCYSGFQDVFTEPLPSNGHIPTQYDPTIASYSEIQASHPYTTLYEADLIGTGDGRTEDIHDVLLTFGFHTK
jgi:hypothetical protein